MTATHNRIESLANSFANGVVRHWLFMLNTTIVIYAALPWLSPLLKLAGWQRTGDLVFRLYGLLCHQLPERSFFVGQYQVSYCHRCTALYSSCALAAVVFGMVRWRWALPTPYLLTAAVPILIDGLWHMADDFLPGLGLRSTVDAVGSINFWLRIVTGTLFGIALVLWVLPRFYTELKKAQTHG